MSRKNYLINIIIKKYTIYLGVFAKLTQNLKSTTKVTYEFFENYILPIHPTSSNYSRKCH